ncbi:putative toxin-antitoxin system toxin component, PIN family [Methyloprofundus sp.]|uniref:putative toxin-antitoxin system toxin component, PIN family n=1 Tax=Methyloprofundus sp. TaxID=2020875 RepID=UPI003D0A56D7
MSKRKIILDTNVLLVSISSKSPYHCIFEKLINGTYDLGVTTEILMEYEEVIERKFNSEVAKDVIRTLLTLPNVEKINVYYNWNLIEADSDDNKFVDCAVSANATGIVTQDKHFNVLRDIEYPIVNLISIADFKSSLC